MASREADLESVLRRVRDFVEDEKDRREFCCEQEDEAEALYATEPARVLKLIDAVLELSTPTPENHP